jgi:hypothetical protein
MDPLELIERKRQELEARRGQILRDLDAISGALQILDELQKELSNENQVSE